MPPKKQGHDIQNATAAEAFKEITAGKDEMDEDAFSIFIVDILKLPEDTLLQFYILTIAMKNPKNGHIHLQHFENLLKYCNAKNIKELKKNLTKIEKELTDRKNFKEMYKQLYDTFLVKDATLDFQFAEMLWTVLLKDEFKLLPEFQEYLEHLGPKKPHKCHRDLWMLMYDFAVAVKVLKTDYKQADGWPVFLDNFAEFINEKSQ